MIKMKVKGIRELIKQIDSDFKRLSKAEFQVESTNMLSALKAATPIDTGKARDSWTITYAGDKALLFNPVPYIEKLNQGHSKQAPSLFIEKTALKFGRPEGSIVSTIPSA